MASDLDSQTRLALRNAFIAVGGVVAFAALYLALVYVLDSLPSERGAQTGIEVATATAPSEPMYVLLIGSDSRKGTALYTGKANEHAQVDQHADIMTLMRIDPTTYTITLVTIPRDTAMPNGGGKINDSLLSNNPNEVVNAAEQLTGVKIGHYMMVSFTAFEDLVDKLGGLDLDVPQTITVPDPATGKNVTVTAGENKHLTGSQALVLARARKEYGDDQEALRQVNVRNIEQAIIRKVLATGADFNADDLLDLLKTDVSTNLDLPILGLSLIDFVEHADEVTIYSCTGPHAGDYRESDGAWVVKWDNAKWSELMAAVDAGEDPAGIVEVPSF